MMRDRASVLNGLPLMDSLATGVRWLPPVSVIALKILTAWSLMVVRMVMAVLLFGLDACDTAGDGHAELQGFAF